MAIHANVQPILLQIGAFLRWDSIPLDTNLSDAKAKLKLALTSLCKCRKNATKLRKSFIDDKIEAAAIAEDTTTETMLKKMRHREAHSSNQPGVEAASPKWNLKSMVKRSLTLERMTSNAR